MSGRLARRRTERARALAFGTRRRELESGTKSVAWEEIDESWLRFAGLHECGSGCGRGGLPVSSDGRRSIMSVRTSKYEK